MACFDTDILVGVIRKDNAAISKFRQYTDYEGRIFTTSVTAAELFEGAYKATDERNVVVVKELLRPFAMHEFDLKAAEIFGLILASVRKKGHVLQDMDALIAAICIANGETLVTRDKDFEKIEGLKTEKW